jgi:hypothetical protein
MDWLAIVIVVELMLWWIRPMPLQRSQQQVGGKTRVASIAVPRRFREAAAENRFFNY